MLEQMQRCMSGFCARYKYTCSMCNVQKNQTYTVASAPAVTGYKVFMRRLNMFLGERSARMLLNNNITVYNITFVKRCFSCDLTQ